jgi:ribonuclease-3
MIDKLQNKLGYNFKNQQYLLEALTHPSLKKTYSEDDEERNYERFEFLGDAVLGLVISEYLVNEYPKDDEGDLAKKKSYLVSGEVLSEIGESMRLGEFILMSGFQERVGGRDSSSIIENVLEAIIGAIYVDSGFEYVKKVILENWKIHFQNVIIAPIEPKTFAQEWAQSNGFSTPIYEIVEKIGPDHQPIFRVAINVVGFGKQFYGQGDSKKAAEKDAARKFYEYVKTNSDIN